MRYAAVTQSRPEAPVHVVGVGETPEEASASARHWFDGQFKRVRQKEWAHVMALQDHLTVFSEEDLEARSGADLDAWLKRMAAVGVVPVQVKPTPAAAEPDVWSGPVQTPQTSEYGTETWVLGAIVFLAVPAFELWWGAKQVALEEPLTTSTMLRIGAAGLMLSLVNLATSFVFLKMLFGMSMQTFIAISLGLRVLASVLMFETGMFGQLHQISQDMDEFDSTMATVEAMQDDPRFFPVGGGEFSDFDPGDFVIPTFDVSALD
jgi:hypothetical protein